MRQSIGEKQLWQTAQIWSQARDQHARSRQPCDWRVLSVLFCSAGGVVVVVWLSHRIANCSGSASDVTCPGDNLSPLRTTTTSYLSLSLSLSVSVSFFLSLSLSITTTSFGIFILSPVYTWLCISFPSLHLLPLFGAYIHTCPGPLSSPRLSGSTDLSRGGVLPRKMVCSS